MADRVSVVTGNQIFRMRPAIHINDPPRMEIAIELVDGLEFGQIHKLGPKRIDKRQRSTRGLATDIRIIQVAFPPLIYSLCPVLDRHLTRFWFSRSRWSG